MIASWSWYEWFFNQWEVSNTSSGVEQRFNCSERNCCNYLTEKWLYIGQLICKVWHRMHHWYVLMNETTLKKTLITTSVSRYFCWCILSRKLVKLVENHKRKSFYQNNHQGINIKAWSYGFACLRPYRVSYKYKWHHIFALHFLVNDKTYNIGKSSDILFVSGHYIFFPILFFLFCRSSHYDSNIFSKIFI